MAPAWYETAFGPHYSDLYGHRDERDAQRALDLIEQIADLPDGSAPVLDLCCGAGRHAVPLRRRTGRPVAALDLSPQLLAAARDSAGESPRPFWIRADMRRLPFADAVFGLVVNLFTSFGYFQRESDHALVLSEVSRVLQRDGKVLLDHIHPAWLRRRLVPESERTTPSGLRVRESRWITADGLRVEKRIRFDRNGAGRELKESVRLFEPGELQALGAAAGLVQLQRYGDFDGSPLGADSPRAIYLFGKAPAGGTE